MAKQTPVSRGATRGQATAAAGRGRKDFGTRTASYDLRREMLVQLAIDVFSRHGYVGGTTTEIAELAGLTQPALYHYVGGKGAFLEEICERVGSKLRGAMEHVLASDFEPGDRLREFIRGHTAVVLSEQAAFRIYVTEASHLPKAAREKLHADERWYQEKLTALAEAAAERGDLPATVPPWLVAQILLGASSWAYRWNRGQVTADELADAVLELLSLTPSSK